MYIWSITWTSSWSHIWYHTSRVPRFQMVAIERQIHKVFITCNRHSNYRHDGLYAATDETHLSGGSRWLRSVRVGRRPESGLKNVLLGYIFLRECIEWIKFQLSVGSEHPFTTCRFHRWHDLFFNNLRGAVQRVTTCRRTGRQREQGILALHIHENYFLRWPLDYNKIRPGDWLKIFGEIRVTPVLDV